MGRSVLIIGLLIAMCGCGDHRSATMDIGGERLVIEIRYAPRWPYPVRPTVMSWDVSLIDRSSQDDKVFRWNAQVLDIRAASIGDPGYLRFDQGYVHIRKGFLTLMAVRIREDGVVMGSSMNGDYPLKQGFFRER